MHKIAKRSNFVIDRYYGQPLGGTRARLFAWSQKFNGNSVCAVPRKPESHTHIKQPWCAQLQLSLAALLAAAAGRPIASFAADLAPRYAPEWPDGFEGSKARLWPTVTPCASPSDSDGMRTGAPGHHARPRPARAVERPRAIRMASPCSPWRSPPLLVTHPTMLTPFHHPGPHNLHRVTSSLPRSRSLSSRRPSPSSTRTVMAPSPPRSSAPSCAPSARTRPRLSCRT